MNITLRGRRMISTVKGLSLELAAHQIMVNCVAPVPDGAYRAGEVANINGGNVLCG